MQASYPVEALILPTSAEFVTNPLLERFFLLCCYEFDRDVARSERSYDFGLIALFANTKASSRYQVHLNHLVLVEKVKNMYNS